MNDRYYINYKIVEKEDDLYKEEEDINYLFCISFTEIKKKEWQLGSKLKNVSMNDFLNSTILVIEEELKHNNLKIDDAFLKMNKSIIFMQNFCHSFVKKDLSILEKFAQVYETDFFAYSKKKQPFYYQYIYKKIDKSKRIHLKTVKNKVYGENFLNSKCSNYDDQLNSNRLNCVNDCYKRNGVPEIRFYRFNESRTLDLNLIFNDANKMVNFRDSIRISKNLNENFKSCLKSCGETDCYLEVLNTIRVRNRYSNLSQNEKNAERFSLATIIYKPFYSITYYFLQFFGLLTLFTGTSLVNTVPMLVNYFALKFRLNYNRYYRSYFPKFKFSLIVVSLIFFFNQSFMMYKDYKSQLNYPNKTRVHFKSIEVEDFSLVLCFPLDISINNNSNVTDKNLEIIERFTFADIEKKSNVDSLINQIHNVSLIYGQREISLSWTASEDVLFSNTTIDEKSILTRCFRIEIELKLLRYKRVTPISSLGIYFEKKYWGVYLVEKNQKFTSNLNSFTGEFYIGVFKK